MMVDVRSAWNGATGVRGSSTSLRAFPTCRAVLLAITTVIESNNGGLRMRFSGRGQQTGGRRLAALAAGWLVDGSIPARGRREWACARRSVAGIRLPVSPERGERRESSSSSPSAFACAGQDGGAVGRGLPGFLWRLRLPMSRRADGSRASTLIRGTGTGGRAGALARSRRCVAAGLLLAFATLLALPLQAQAQNVLISNLGQTDGNVGSLVSFDQAQAFTTGDNFGGYALTSVEIQTTGTPTLNALRVSIRADSSGSPGATSLGTLKNPASVASDGIAAFTASGAGIDLEKETTYFVVVDVTTGTSGNIQNTSSDAEDAGAAANWSIGNASVFRNKRGGSWGSWAQSKKIRINGTVKAGASASDADLTGLALKNAADDSAVTLSPGFATATKSYTASVANDAAAVTVEPAQSDSNATVAYLNASDMALTDADMNKTGFQVDLDVGANTIKVKVTAEDGNTTDTYTVVVTRAATSTDATLSALALKDGSTAITLSPGFSSTVTTYTASVANAVDEITIVPEVNESNATYEIQDSGGTALADADDMEDGFQVDLDVGANTIEVEVTAEDTTTMETYTVVATRAAASSLTASLESPDYVVGGNLQYRFDLKLTEAVAIPNRDVRDHAFSVTNGRMVKAKRIHEGPGGSNHWRMTVEPYDETKPVTVTLRGNRACSEQGALCTGGGDHVINSPTLTLSAETLTLDSGNLPSVSIGNATAKENDAFLSFTVKLSRKVARTVAVDFKTVSGGTATEGADYRAQDYRVLFTPGETSIEAGVALIADTVDDVGETVKAEIANARVITARGAELGPLTITTAQATGTIDAPATSTTDVSNLTIRIDDTTGDEDDGWLDFSVSLSRTYTEYVCFDFETLTTGTATEGTDYSPRPKVNDWIRPGATQTTAFVPIIDDSVSDSGETVKVKISNARLCGDASKTVTINRAEATGTITNSDHIPQAWLARFGRTVADQVIDAVDGRLGAARRPGVEATLAGQSIAGAPEGDGTRQSMAEDAASRVRLEAMSNWLRGDTGERREGLFGSRAVSERDLLAATAFFMTGKTDGGGSVALWGRGAIASFDGRESRLSVDGEVANLMLGADWSGGALTAGLMLSHARGSGGYRGESDGKVESTLTGIYPYGRYAASERITVWGVAGYGAGSLALKPEDEAVIETDMDLMMAAVGLRGVAMKAPEGGGPELAVKSDAMVVRTTSDAVQGLEAATAEVTRLRLGLEGSWRVIAGGGEFVPRLEIGVRHDGGDAETGFGVDIGGGLAWSDRASGVAAEVSGRALLTHASGGFREHGFAGSLTWDPTPDSERGLKLTLRQSVGAEANEGVDALLSRGTMAGLAANDNGDGRRRREVKFGYGFEMFEGRFTGTPEIGLGLSEVGRDYSLGWRLTRAGSGAGSLDLSVEARRRESANDDVPPEHGIGFAATARW